jgi:hypothetical protein
MNAGFLSLIACEATLEVAHRMECYSCEMKEITLTIEPRLRERMSPPGFLLISGQTILSVEL